MLFYRLFHLTLCSPLPCPLLESTESSTPDVTIRFDNCPEFLNKPVDSKNFVDAHQGQLLLRLDGVATIYVQSGNLITVDLASDADMDLVWTYILGSAMGTVLHQRGALVLHGNAIVDIDDSNSATVFVAVSGGGKSTLAAALCQAGYKILSDDVSAIIFDEQQQPWVMPSYEHIKLWQDSVNALGFGNELLRPIKQRENKFNVAMGANYYSKPAQLKQVFILEEDNVFSCRALSGTEAFISLMKHTYRMEFLNLMGLNSKHFEQCGQLLARTPIALIQRPKNDPLNAPIVDWLKQANHLPAR